MSFEQTVHAVIHDPNSRENTLGDGKATVTYGQLPALFDALRRYFETHDIQPSETVAVECTNSVMGAVLEIFLLVNGYGFMLLPPAGAVSKQPGYKPDIPLFCRHHLIVAPSQNLAEDWWHDLPSLLQISANPDYQSDTAQLAERIYLRTSGSTGKSKIVVHTHANLLPNALNCVTKYQLNNRDRVFIPIPIFHMYGFGAAFLSALAAGASIELMENTNLLRYLGRERAFNPNVAFVIPTLCEMIVQGRKKSRPFKVVITSGARIKESTFRAFDALCGETLVSQYGSTEMGATSACQPSDDLELRATSIGTPMEQVVMRVEPLNDDDPTLGELECHHPFSFEKYINDHGSVLRQAPADGWFISGDLAQQLPSGHIKVLGRAGQSVNRNGFLVQFADIERAIEQIEGVAQVVVVAGQSETKFGRKLVAFCVPSADLSYDEVRAGCAERLPRYAIPDEIFVERTLPHLPSGKLDRQTLTRRAG